MSATLMYKLSKIHKQSNSYGDNSATDEDTRGSVGIEEYLGL
jgi:hypothetical protein